MTTIIKALVESKYAENAETMQYTSDNCKTTIDKFTATNVTGVNATISVKLVASGGTAGAANTISFTTTIAPGKAYQFPELVGHVLEAGDFISTLAGTATAIVIRVSGRQIT